jgi:hypothetical protein
MPDPSAEVGNKVMIEPLATYREVMVHARRRFDLYKDRVIVYGKAANVEAETVVRLSDLNPWPNTIRVRHKWFRMAILMFFGAFLTLIAAASTYPPPPGGEVLPLMLGSTSFALFFVGSIIFGYTYRMLKFISFNSHAGVKLLDVGDAGPDRADFDSFVERLIARIEANQV